MLRRASSLQTSRFSSSPSLRCLRRFHCKSALYVVKASSLLDMHVPWEGGESRKLTLWHALLSCMARSIPSPSTHGHGRESCSHGKGPSGLLSFHTLHLTQSGPGVRMPYMFRTCPKVVSQKSTQESFLFSGTPGASPSAPQGLVQF